MTRLSRSSLASLRAPELGAVAVKAAVERAGIDPKAVQEVRGKEGKERRKEVEKKNGGRGD